jgi:hypothetical protein
MCVQLNEPGGKICKCKFANVCKRRIVLERIMAHDRTDRACPVSTPRPVNNATTIDFISNKIYPLSNFVHY